MSFKTLIIDDSSIHRLAISFLVKNHPQLELVGAYADPYEGFKAIYDHQVDIVFLDVLLENVNSFELLDEIKIPAAIIMNSSRERFSVKAKKYGIQNFLVKPLRKETFEIAVNNTLKSFETNDKGQVLDTSRPYFMPKPNVFQKGKRKKNKVTV